MPKLMLDRQTLARLLQNDHQAIVAFEKVLGDVGDALPSTLEEVSALANMASALANLAMTLVEQNSERIELLSFVPAPLAPEMDSEYRPASVFGTLGQQNADSVEITGGSIDGTTIGATSASTGAFTTLSANGQITSTLATGTAPLVVASVTKVSNLNADLLDGADWAAPGTIGGTTPASANFTTISASGQVTSTLATGTAPFVVASTTKVANLNADQVDGGDWAVPGALGSTTPNSALFTTLTASGLINAGSGQLEIARNLTDLGTRRNWGWQTETVVAGDMCLFVSTTNTGSPYAGTQIAQWTATGLKVAVAFGCNNATPQAAAASGAALAAYAAGANGLSSGANMQALVDKVIAMDAALKANGILS